MSKLRNNLVLIHLDSFQRNKMPIFFMKSIFTIVGTFVFALFIESFSRVVIVFYKQQELVFSGLDSIPGTSWTIILFTAIFAGTWLAGMLTVTITTFSPSKHLIALYFLLLIWRLSEYFSLSESTPSWYFPSMLVIQAIALSIAYILKQKMDDQIS